MLLFTSAGFINVRTLFITLTAFNFLLLKITRKLFFSMFVPKIVGPCSTKQFEHS